MSPSRPRPPWASSLLVNLAGSPFVNRRPVQRFTLAAWVIGVLLAGVNVFLWLQYRHDSTALRARLVETRSAIDAKSRNLVAMHEELGGLGLAGQNAQVEFLNQRIAERTFPWSLLFERVANTLPDGVRILGLNPVFRERDDGRPGEPEAGAPPPEELVDLKFQGVAKTDEELYRLIDAFFSSPLFERPRLYQESRAENEVQFTVDVQYRPQLEQRVSRRTPSADDGERPDDEEGNAEGSLDGDQDSLDGDERNPRDERSTHGDALDRDEGAAEGDALDGGGEQAPRDQGSSSDQVDADGEVSG